MGTNKTIFSDEAFTHHILIQIVFIEGKCKGSNYTYDIKNILINLFYSGISILAFSVFSAYCRYIVVGKVTLKTIC